MFTNKKSGKKIFNIKKNDQFSGSCLINKEKDKFIALFLKDNLKYKLIIFELKEVPYLQKGSGVILFKTKGFKLNNFCSIDDNLSLIDIDSKKIELGNLKSFLSKRGKSGKVIKLKKEILLNKGFTGYYKLNS